MLRSRLSTRAAVLWSVPLVVIYAFYLVGALAAAAGLPYEAMISLPEAVVAARTVPLADAWNDVGGPPHAWFLPASAALWVVYLSFQRRRHLRRWTLLAAALLPPLPLLLLSRSGLFSIVMLPVLAPIVTVQVLTGTADGETYSEGWPCLAAIAWWYPFLLAVLLRDLCSYPPSPHRCPACDYNLRGLAAPRCPECGRPSPGSV